MSHCIYCQQLLGTISKVCKDCHQLIRSVKKLDDDFGYRMLLDTLLETGVDPERIEKFLDADPDGEGSFNQKIAARMTNQVMGDLGQPSEMTAEDVKKVQEKMKREESYLKKS